MATPFLIDRVNSHKRDERLDSILGLLRLSEIYYTHGFTGGRATEDFTL